MRKSDLPSDSQVITLCMCQVLGRGEGGCHIASMYIMYLCIYFYINSIKATQEPPSLYNQKQEDWTGCPDNDDMADIDMRNVRQI